MAPRRGASRGNWPATQSQLVSREVDQRQIEQLVPSGQSRLVSLVGAPGSGKTRLAVMVGESLATAFPDGAVFVDLSVLHDAEQVPSAVASAIGLREPTDRNVAQRVFAWTQHRKLLLVLDNFEHLLPAAAFVADLLVASAELKILTTTREALRISGEQRYAVGPLEVPTAAQEKDVQQLGQVPAVALFCVRSAAVNSVWQLNLADAHAVGEICRRLDGLPLAIELAAAWSAVLSPRAILSRLDECLNVQRAAAPHQPERHRTLSASITWSYDLLSSEERALFDRLGVFADGWDQQAAAAAGELESKEAFRLLASLAEKHLITVAAAVTDGEPRFGLLDTLHAFAISRLDQRSADETRERHARHFLALAERAERALIGPDQRTWLDRLERELGNFRAALRWAIDRGESPIALRLAAALWFFWDMRGHLREGQQWLESALALGGSDDVSHIRPWALNASGWLALVQHASYGPAVALLEEARSAAVAVGDERALVRAQAFLGLTLAIATREHSRTEELLDQAVAGARTVGDAWALALALYGQGHVALVQGDAERVQDRWQTCAAVAQDVGNLYGLSYLQFRWGVLALMKLDLERANACLRESLRLSAELDSIREMAVAIAALVLVAGAAGQAERAGRLAGGVRALLDRAGCDLPAFLVGEYERGVTSLRDRVGAERLEQWIASGRSLPMSNLIDEARVGPSDGGAGTDFGPTQHLFAPLSPREWEVATLVAQGAKNREIAERLVLAQRTIESHLERIYERLEISNRAQLARWMTQREFDVAGTNEVIGGTAADRPSLKRLRVVGNQR
jgi:predicted ATPase/DNA-binding CsgD family transcriptional regulator